MNHIDDPTPRGSAVPSWLTWLIIGAGAFLALVLFTELSASGRRGASKVSRVKNDMRSLATGIETYFVDHNVYPPMTPLRDQATKPKRVDKAGGAGLMTLSAAGVAGSAGMTTPIAYVMSLYPDSFAPDRALSYAYYKDDHGWILISAGPDGDYDIRDPARIYTSKFDQPSSAVVALSYDPTNGISSSGDVFRVKQ